MPYSGPDDADLPEGVKKLPKKKREQWIEVFESSIKNGDDESTAFRKAYGAVKNKGYFDDVYQMAAHQLTMETVEYNPLGATSEKGCANCNWFGSPNCCVIVSGDISPTGICKLWLENQYLPVAVENKSLIKTLVRFFKQLGVRPPVRGDMQFYKQSDGRTRFFAVYSNHFKDRVDEIITDQAHREFVEYCTKENYYPDLWLWHSGEKSKWGTCDWIDYCSGFVCVSGLVDVDKEHIAKSLEEEDIAVSHGFIALRTHGKYILQYRSFEVSPLPSKWAANEYTYFNIVKELNMPFAEEKKKWLKNVAGIDDATIESWESNLDKLSSKLKDLGIEWKSVEETDIGKDVAALVNAVSSLADVVAEIKEAQKSLTSIATNLDSVVQAKVKEAFVAEVNKVPSVQRPTESSSNVVEKSGSVSNSYDWFFREVNNMFSGGTNNV